MTSYTFQTLQLQVLSIIGLEQLKARSGQVLELRVDLIGASDSMQTQRLILPVQPNSSQWTLQQQRMQFHLQDLTPQQRLQTGKLRLRLQWNPLWSSWLGGVVEQLIASVSENHESTLLSRELSQEEEGGGEMTDEKDDEMNQVDIWLASLSFGVSKKYCVQLDPLRFQLQLKWLTQDTIVQNAQQLTSTTNDQVSTNNDITIIDDKSVQKCGKQSDSKKKEEMAGGEEEIDKVENKKMKESIKTIDAGDRPTTTLNTNTPTTNHTMTTETTSHDRANLLNLQLNELRNLLYPKLAHCLENENLALEAQTPIDDRCVCVYVHSKSVRPPTSAQTTYQSQHQRLLHQLDRPPIREYTQRLMDSLIQKSLKNGRLCLLHPRKRLQRLGEQSEWRLTLSVWLEQNAGASYEWMNRLSSTEMQRMQLITLRNCLNQRKVLEQRQELNQQIAQQVRQRLKQMRKQIEKRQRLKQQIRSGKMEGGGEEHEESIVAQQDQPINLFGWSLSEDEQLDRLSNSSPSSSSMLSDHMRKWSNRKQSMGESGKNLKETAFKSMKSLDESDGEQDDQVVEQLDTGWRQEEKIAGKKRKNWNRRVWTFIDMRMLLKPFCWAARALYQAFNDPYSRSELRLEVKSGGDRIDAPPPPNVPYSELGARSVTAALKQLNWAHTRGPFLYGRVEECE